MHIHLDALGGISGNMFIGALLDLSPEHAAHLPRQLEKAGFANLVELRVGPQNDGIFTGTYVSVSAKAVQPAGAGVRNPATAAHPHRSWREIKALLEQSRLDNSVKTHALGIFAALASAEAKVHGKAADAVEFHEVGAWDSIADIVCAAYLIAVSGAQSWTVSLLPPGRGQVRTAHGMLPLPAPAVTLLLQGYRFQDDGREGERVTPTGAAILHYLKASQDPLPPDLCLRNSGIGFGSRQFPGISNVLRALAFTRSAAASPGKDSISVLSFEVDDQSPEDLALALDVLRQQTGVLDVLHYSVAGKKQRMCTSVRVLATPEAESEVMRQCFMQTTTLGIRHERCQRSVLERNMETVALDGKQYRVKLTRRPGGDFTAKAELDDLAHPGLSQADRQLIRETVEAVALERRFERTAADMPGDREPDDGTQQ